MDVNLKWDSFTRIFTSSLKVFSEENILTDVTLVSDDLVEVSAHRLVLSSASPVLREIILRSGEGRPTLYLRGVKHKTLKSLLQFIYEGKTSLPEDEVKDVVDIAVDFEIKDFFNEHFEQEKETIIENGKVNEKSKEKKIKKKDKQKKTKNKTKTEEKTLEQIPMVSVHLNEFKKESLDETQTSIPCLQCDHHSRSVAGAKYHRRVKHSNTLYNCKYCQKTCSDRSSLNKHEASMHEGVRYPCSDCKYEATQRGSLRIHVLAMHQGIRHKCNLCEVKCYSAGLLKKHINRCHVRSSSQ